MLYVMLGVAAVCAICIFYKSSLLKHDEDMVEMDIEGVFTAEEQPEKEMGQAEGETEKGMEQAEGDIINLRSGFYEIGTEILLTVREGTTVYYTLDGSMPSIGGENTFCLEKSTSIELKDASSNPNVYSARSDSSIAYEEYMHYAGLEKAVFSVPDESVDKCNVVQAIAVDTAGNIVSSQTEVYFVGFQEKQGYDSLKMVALVVEPEDFWGYDKGINVLGRTFDKADKEQLFATYGQGYSFYSANFRNKGAEWERETNVFIFDEGRKLIEEKNVGIRVKGNASRGVAQKSFNLYARKRYDENDKFTGELFRSGAECKTITLFNGGPYSQDKLRDLLSSEFVMNLKFATLEYEPCALFINGEYWGMYYLSEKIDGVYLHNNYGINKNNVIVVKKEAIEEGLPEDLEIYRDMVDYVSNNDMSLEENYQNACQLIDMESFIDYYAYEIYINNEDWPGNNVALWRVKEISEDEYCDGRWRYILYDVDASLGWPDRDSIVRTIEKDKVFQSLLNNERFREMFFTRLLDIGNICFEDTIVQQYIDEYRSSMKDNIVKSIKRWYYDGSVETFLYATLDISRFFSGRFANMKEFIVSFYEMQQSSPEKSAGAANINVGETTHVYVAFECNDENARITLNGLEIKNRSEILACEYLRGMELKFDIPIGEETDFAGWRINGAEELIPNTSYSFALEDATYVKAVFKQ